MDMSDGEIGELMNVVRSTVYRHRMPPGRNTKMMEEEYVENNTKRILFAVIVAATNGDETGNTGNLNFNDSYISKLSLTQTVMTSTVMSYMVVDSGTKRQNTGHMDMIANFEIIVVLMIPDGQSFPPFPLLAIQVERLFDSRFS